MKNSKEFRFDKARRITKKETDKFRKAIESKLDVKRPARARHQGLLEEKIMGFPKSSEIKKVLKKLEKTEGTLALPANSTPLEKFRHDIQQKFVAYVLTEKITQRELAKVLGIDEGKVSKILRNRISEFSTDRLISLYEKINPSLKLKVG